MKLKIHVTDGEQSIQIADYELDDKERASMAAMLMTGQEITLSIPAGKLQSSLTTYERDHNINTEKENEE